MHKPLRYIDTEYMTASSYPAFTSLRSLFLFDYPNLSIYDKN